MRREEREDADVGGLAGFVLGTELDWASKAFGVDDGVDVGY